MTHEQTRLERIAVPGKLLNENGADRIVPVTVGLHGDRRPVGNRHPPTLGRTIRPENCINVVGNHAVRYLRWVGRINAAGLGQLVRECATGAASTVRHELPQARFTISSHYKLAIGQLGEVGDAQPRHEQRFDDWSAAGLLERRDLARAQVGEDVLSDQRRYGRAAIDVPTDYRATIIARILVNGIGEPGSVASAGAAVRTLSLGPTVVALFDDLVDFLPVGTTYVSGPYLTAAASVLGDPPGVPQAHCVHFGRAATARIRVARRNAVRRSGVDINSEQFAVPCERILNPVSLAAVAHSHIEITVLTEEDRSDTVKSTPLLQ